MRHLAEQGDVKQLRQLAEADDDVAAFWLANRLADRGDTEEAIHILSRLAANGNGAAADEPGIRLASRVTADVRASTDA